MFVYQVMIRWDVPIVEVSEPESGRAIRGEYEIEVKEVKKERIFLAGAQQHKAASAD
jgi:hypothetical protein